MRAALYARVSTLDQEPENQLLELRAYAALRGWQVREYVDHGVSGARESRPALDALVRDAKRRRFDVLVVWRLDRLGRNLRHLVLLLDELQATGVDFVTLGEGIDTSTPAGRLQLHILSAMAEFERARIPVLTDVSVTQTIAPKNIRGGRVGPRRHRRWKPRPSPSRHPRSHSYGVPP
ncbi:DNA-invertase hin [Luteitalea pratensis]|uniref:DNA-invertase hin n=1 Tax=Luteitalea pratensis TaxID=1855912 RepID=A0A143PND8_LUTPR|nr:recombinase family protein [Luteitalea pratensis]AMY09608.1 DNA-invertase hin [Luteitalea pratensis]